MRVKYYTNLVFFTLLTVFSCTGQDRTKNWEKDIDFLLQEAQKQHYVYKNQALPQPMTEKAALLKKHIMEYSDERMLIELERLMYELGDGHSYILPFGASVVQAHFLPLKFYAFTDGLFIIDADSTYAPLIGWKVKRIAAVTPEKFMADMTTYISQDNIMGAKWIGPFFLRFRGMLEAYGLAKNADAVELELEDKNGKVKTEQITFVPVPRLRGIPKLNALQHNNSSETPLYLSNLQSNFWTKTLPEHQTLYWQFNQVMNDERESIAAFAKRLDTLISTTKPQKLIIDTRHNNGGNGDLVNPLIEVLKRFETEKQGKIIVLTGRNTFSAAQIFITKVEQATKAIFIGEPSSSSPNFVGEENMVQLPYSGALGSISNRYHQNSVPSDKRKWIEPHIKIELSSQDYFMNRDPILEAALKQ